jgi:SH3 domain protein
VRTLSLMAAAALTLMVGATPALAEYVKDEVRINMRTGPGLQFRITHVLKSGDRVRIVSRRDDWTQVAAGGEEGWIPAGYLTVKEPAAVAVPALEAKLVEAQEQISTLEARLAEQAEAIGEIESLRTRNAELESSNAELAAGSRWRVLLAGAAIVLIGMLVGALGPRLAAGRQRRIKL